MRQTGDKQNAPAAADREDALPDGSGVSIGNDAVSISQPPEDCKGEPMRKPGYWAVLPAQIRYDPAIPPNAKLLYAEISSLTDVRGYCYAANAYFEQLYELSERTIIRLIRALESAGYIRVEDGAGGKAQRKIFAGVNPLTPPPDKNVSTPLTKMSVPPDKNVTPNNIKKDIRKETTQKACAWKPDLFERFWKAYPRHEDKAGARREWDRLKPDRELMQTMSAALERAKTSDEWRRGIGIPYACRWLSHRRWEDEFGGAAPQRTVEAADVQDWTGVIP